MATNKTDTQSHPDPINFAKALSGAGQRAERMITQGSQFAHIGCWIRTDSHGSQDWSTPSALIVIIGNPGELGEPIRAAIDRIIQDAFGTPLRHERSVLTSEGEFTTNIADPVN